jgi:tRNA modification GTPase
MKKGLGDTITAIATPTGEGAISVIRISGEAAIIQAAHCFKGKQNLLKVKSHTAHYGQIVDSHGRIIDHVLCTVFRSPASFTGENTVEVSCHGGILVTRQVLECFIEAGARPAEPGEFTQRAFLNGKIDLSQAEAIADLIQAQSEKAYKISLDQLEGALSTEIRFVRDQLLTTLGLLELELDFVEEDIELIDKKKIVESLQFGINEIEKLVNTYKYGKVWRDGVSVALVGAPNSGKSSLLNALLNENRAIVTNIPGTTRDFIEEKMKISGVLFRVIDTAGLRVTEDLLEQEGMKQTWKVVQTADIIVLVHDCTNSISSIELEFLENLRKNYDQRGLILANNKIDLESRKQIKKSEMPGVLIIETSALSHAGVSTLISELSKYVLEKTPVENKESTTISNERHYSSLLKAKEALSTSLQSCHQNESGEFIAVDLRRAIDSLGEIIGIVTSEDILNTIFSRFCIGK